jgi:arabinose-5-phosphate isomerase
MHHPGGALGRRLLVHVADIMRTGERLPRTPRGALLPEAIVEMSGKGIGMTCIVDDDDRLLGIFTDGDLRRTLQRHDSIRALRVEDVMTREPRSIAPGKLAVEAARMLEQHPLGGRLVVLDGAGRLIGALTFHDLLAAGVV